MGLLANIQLTEDQQKEFSNKLDAWKNEQRADIEKELETKYKGRLDESENIITDLKSKQDKKISRITEDKDLDFTDEETAILKDKLTKWKEKIQEETEEALGDKFFETFKEGEGKLKKEFSDKFIKTLKEIYEEVENSVKDKLKESAEFKAFSKVKETIAPFIVEGEYTDTINEDVNKLKEIIAEQKEQLDKIKVQTKLDQLLAGMPENIREDFVSNLGDIKTEDELIEAFQKNIKFMKTVKDTVVSELKESDEEETKDEEGSEESAEEAKEGEGDTPAEETKEESSEEKPAEEVKEDVKKTENEKIVEDIASKKKENKTSDKKSSEEGGSSKDVDYDILTEDFKREEVKSKNFKRMQELAGVI